MEVRHLPPAPRRESGRLGTAPFLWRQTCLMYLTPEPPRFFSQPPLPTWRPEGSVPWAHWWQQQGQCHGRTGALLPASALLGQGRRRGKQGQQEEQQKNYVTRRVWKWIWEETEERIKQREYKGRGEKRQNKTQREKRMRGAGGAHQRENSFSNWSGAASPHCPLFVPLPKLPFWKKW